MSKGNGNLFGRRTSPLNETTEKARVNHPYQRRVTVTMTRSQAEAIRKVLLRLSADPVARANAGMPPGNRQMKLCHAVWVKLDRAVVQRDKAQAAKEHYDSTPVLVTPAVDGEIDVPLEGL